jgi:8-oxo-dGTP pyrophosphatase MutT (NUDIX family)
MPMLNTAWRLRTTRRHNPPSPPPPHFLIIAAGQSRASALTRSQGEGVAEDHKAAVEWFKLAAAQGHDLAMNALYILGKWARTAERRKREVQ